MTPKVHTYKKVTIPLGFTVATHREEPRRSMRAQSTQEVGTVDLEAPHL